jgi:septal ring factor EnvC (AmiA/AmiB activator)
MSSNPDRETEPMSLRSNDPHTPIFKITREITPWQLGGAAVVVGLLAATIHFTQRSQGEKLDTVITDVKQVLATQKTTEHQTRDLQYEVKDLTKRVTAIEGALARKEQP